jgi:L-aminopeptidase/D-esterase-like protein
MMNGTLTDVPGMRVGHQTNLDALTGCTVILCPPGTVGGVDVRGGAPGTRETDLLRPEYNVEVVTGVVLAGGSAYGLATADGVMRYCAEHDLGYKTRSGKIVPIIPTAILFDLGMGDADTYPNAAMGYAAAAIANTDAVSQGTVGAGTGAVCGAILGKQFATKGGLGSASIEIVPGMVVAALVAVNAVGDILDEAGKIIAGVRQPPDGNTFMGMLPALRQVMAMQSAAESAPASGENTVIGVVATNARLSKAHVNKVAQMAHDGIARAVNPAHTMYDGDTIFALATGEVPGDATLVGAFAAEAMSQAIRNAIRHATGADGVRAWNE